jgi:hypothetical protein
MHRIVIALLLATSLFAQLPPREAADGWVQLFDGDTNFGWTPEGTAQWQVVSKTLVAEGTGKGWLRSNAAFADFILKFDYRQGKDGNSGVFIRSAKEGQPHETGYEVQLWEGHPKYWTGSLVNHIQAKKTKPKPGVWHTMEIQALGDRFTVTLDGKTILDGKDAKSRMGHIGLQANEGKRIEFRNIMLKPLGLASIFNGKDLGGWKIFDTSSNARIKEPAVWSVKAGLLHVEKGPGQIETEKSFQNFALQLDVRTNSQDPKRHPNSGVFLRGTPNGWWSGYESQIRNEFTGDDRTQVVDYGTGAIYKYNNARKIVANDNEFFTKTIVANGAHFSVWVNGYQVTDLEDAKETKLGAGVISLQAHDPTTNLDFRNIRIAELK